MLRMIELINAVISHGVFPQGIAGNLLARLTAIGIDPNQNQSPGRAGEVAAGAP